jgi:hypothetical protein
MLDVSNPNTQEQQTESSSQEEDARSREDQEPDSNQQITSPSKGEDAQKLMAHDAEA